MRNPDDIAEEKIAQDRFTSNLGFVPETRARLARELRRMAAAEGTEYQKFTDVSAWTRSVWVASAELIESIEG